MSRDSLLTEVEEYMMESIRTMYRSWRGRKLLPGEELPPMPPQLATLMTKAHQCILKTRNAGVADERVFDEMSSAEKLLALEEAIREEREKAAEKRELMLEVDDEMN